MIEPEQLKKNQVWRHLKTRDLYVVTDPCATLENTREPVVIYRTEGGPQWVRPQCQFLDGRFELVPESELLDITRRTGARFPGRKYFCAKAFTAHERQCEIFTDEDERDSWLEEKRAENFVACGITPTAFSKTLRRLKKP